MRGHESERGAALILLLGIVAALAILATILVTLLANQQWGTAKSRESKTSLYYAEAGLNSAVNEVTGDTSWLTARLHRGPATAMATNYNTLPGAPTGATISYRVYDNENPIDYSKLWDYNSDGKVWVEVTTTYQGRTTTVRELVSVVVEDLDPPQGRGVRRHQHGPDRHDQHLRREPRRYVRRLGSAVRDDHHGGRRLYRHEQREPRLPGPHGPVTRPAGQQPGQRKLEPCREHEPCVVAGWRRVLSATTSTAPTRPPCPPRPRPARATSPRSSTSRPRQSARAYRRCCRNMTYSSATKTYTATKDLEYNSSTTLTLNTASTTYNFQKLYVNGNLTLSGQRPRPPQHCT